MRPLISALMQPTGAGLTLPTLIGKMNCLPQACLKICRLQQAVDPKMYNIYFLQVIMDWMASKLKIGTNRQISYAKQDKLSSSGDAPGIIRHALLRPPVLGVYKDVNDPTYS